VEWRAKILIGIFVAIVALPAIASAEQFHEPKAVTYEPAGLANYSTGDLIDLLSGPSFDRNGVYAKTGPDYTKAVQLELARRHPIERLATIFRLTTDDVQQYAMLEVLEHLGSPESEAALRSLATRATERANFLANLHFARRCDRAALANLNARYRAYPVSSVQLASAAKAFGDCDFKPAIPNLVDSVDAASMNLGWDAHLSLQKMYPDAKIDTSTPETTQRSWRAYLSRRRN
jgi:hypothetical protein